MTHTTTVHYTSREHFIARKPAVWQLLDEIGVATEFYAGYVHQQLALHSPGVVLLSYLVRGNGIHVLGDARYAETGGSLGITHYDQFHDILTDAEGMDIMNIYLDPATYPLPALPRELQRVLPDILPLHPCLQHRLNRMVRIQFSHPAAVTPLVLAMHEEMQQSRPGYREAAMHYFTLFLIACCRQVLHDGLASTPSPLPTPDARLEILRRELDQHYAQAYTLAELAARLGVTPVHLSRSFKAYTGLPLFDYLIKRRIQGAMLRLRTSADPIVDIALDCGFNDLSHFNRKFKALVGEDAVSVSAGM